MRQVATLQQQVSERQSQLDDQQKLLRKQQLQLEELQQQLVTRQVSRQQGWQLHAGLPCLCPMGTMVLQWA